MKTSEIRRGNYVSYEGETSLISSINHDRIGIAGLCGGLVASVHTNDKETVKPIPINNKWAYDLGGDRHAFEGEYRFYLTIDGDFKITVSEYDYGVRLFIGNESLKLDIQFVHELQNLYHSLTGKELTLEKTNEEKARDVMQGIVDESIKKFAESTTESEKATKSFGEGVSAGIRIANAFENVIIAGDIEHEDECEESEYDRIQRQLKEMLSDAPTADEFCEYLAKLYDRYKNG